jgi:hypothetical protein
MQLCHGKSSIRQEEEYFISKLDLKLRKNWRNAAFRAYHCMVLKLGHFGK